MNTLLLISGLVAGFCTAGHFIIGSKSYLKPMLAAAFDDVAKKVMHCVFHYVSVFLVLSSIALLLLGFGIHLDSDAALMVKFIALHYAFFALIQLVIALTSKIEKALLKMFQGTIFVLIAVFAWLGAS
ncbi:MAG: hypothetical protein JSU83_12240 [Deltaproteobacteria bacterium]|nr:MAG: hypothetical protein JSU83_12240 [Deltaproteobacteria bacterium]